MQRTFNPAIGGCVSPVRSIPRTLDVVPVTISSSNAETNLLNYTIAGNSLSKKGKLRVSIGGKLINNTGSNQTVTLKIYLGSTTIYNDATANIATSASARDLDISLNMACVQSMDAQKFNGEFSISSSAAAATTGVGGLDTAALIIAKIANESTEDMTADKILRVTLTLSASSSSLSFTGGSSLLEWL